MVTAGKNSVYLSAELAAAVIAAREAEHGLTLGELVRRGLGAPVKREQAGWFKDYPDRDATLLQAVRETVAGIVGEMPVLTADEVRAACLSALGEVRGY